MNARILAQLGGRGPGWGPVRTLAARFCTALPSASSIYAPRANESSTPRPTPRPQGLAFELKAAMRDGSRRSHHSALNTFAIGAPMTERDQAQL